MEITCMAIVSLQACKSNLGIFNVKHLKVLKQKKNVK